MLKILRWILTCLVFYALPFILISYGLGNRWKLLEIEHREKLFDELDNVLLSIKEFENTEVFFQKLFSRLVELASKSQNSLETLKRGIKNISGRFPGVCIFYVLDSSGKLVESISAPNSPKALLRKLFVALNSSEQEKRRLALEKQWSVFRSFIGTDIPPEIIAERSEELIEVATMEKKRFFYFAIRKQFALFVHLNKYHNWNLLSGNDQVRRYALFYPSYPTIRVGLIDISDSRTVTPEIKPVIKIFDRTSKSHIEYDGFMYSVMGFASVGRLWAARPTTDAINLDSARQLINIFGSLIFALLAFLSFRVIVKEQPLVVSIRWQLIVLFFFATGLPLAVFVLAGWDYMRHREKTLIKETHEECERLLKAFDMRFPQMRNTMQTKITEIMKRLRYDTPANIEKTHKIFLGNSNFIQRSQTVIYDYDGKIIFRNRPEIKGASQARKIIGEISRRVLACLNHEVPEERSDSSNVVLHALKFEDNPITALARELGRILDFSLVGNQNWSFFYAIKSPSGRATNLIFSMWGKTDLERLYLRKNLLSEQRKLSANRGRLVAFDANFDWMFPRMPNLAKALSEFLRKLALRQATTVGEIFLGQNRYLVTGIKPKELSGSFLVTVLNSKSVDREIKSIAINLWIFTLFCILLSGFLGFLLSERFLTPISDLTIGVKAIQERNFSVRIPIRERDELGDLSSMFNRVMEGLADLEVGRIVQESLFPSDEIRFGEYRIYGKTSTASELGGDYFDYRKLPDNRLLFLIGDVSGHGVPAALVMAMAKALVERESEIDTLPEVMLQNIHQVFFRVLKRRRMMTCFLGVLDPVKHQLRFANAGHNYPYLFRINTLPQQLISQSAPLGSRAKLTLSPQTFDLLPGDRVVMYTDGLVEARTHDGEIGYERMSQNVNKLLSDDPRESIEKIFSWHRNLTGIGPQADDITLVIVCRSSESIQDSVEDRTVFLQEHLCET